MKPANRAIWIVALAVAVLWPSRVLSPLDGVPLNGPLEAVLIGVLLPALLWLNPGFVVRRSARTAIVALLLLKAAASVALPQHGLCARFSTSPPLAGVISTIEISEPGGWLRSWDLRADWRSSTPRCTAVFDRAYESRDRFPVWFDNLLNALRPNADVTLDVDGFVNVSDAGTLSIATGNNLILAGTVSDVAMTAVAGPALTARVPPGSHRLHLHGSGAGPQWRFIPLWNGRDAYAAARLTTAVPTSIGGAIAASLSWVIILLVAGLLLLLVVDTTTNRLLIGPAAAWGIVAAAVLGMAAFAGRFERVAPLLLIGAAFVPVRSRQQSMRVAFLMLGIPWLALFVVRSLPHLGSVTIYSVGDDWQMFQSAAYSIVLNGQWITGGSRVFLFQAFYRWVVAALHVVFGDPSVGELYWDAACLLVASLACFALVKPVSGFRAAIAAAALTLATFTVGPIWYLIGRGLSEITAVGWMALAVMFLLRARLGHLRAAAAAALFAVLMFWTRLNHLLLTGFLLTALLPLRTSTVLTRLRAAFGNVRVRAAVIYAAITAGGVAFYAGRTWWYSGHFSLTYGSSFAAQQTGLSASTVASPAVWTKIVEALGAQLSMREPPAFDPRSILVGVGAVMALLALLQVPRLNRLPAVLVFLTFGTIIGSLFAHTHDYPGRMSVHVVPFAIALSVCAAAKVTRVKNGSSR